MVLELLLLTLTVLPSFPAYIDQAVAPFQQDGVVAGQQTEVLPNEIIAQLTTTALVATPTIAPLNTPTPTTVPTPLPPSGQAKPATPKPSVTPSPKPTATPLPSSGQATPVPAATSASSIAPTATPAAPVATDLDSLFSKYSDQYKIDREQLKRIAVCESKLNSKATNIHYAGLYQFSASSWASVRKEMGLNADASLRTNAEEAIMTAAHMIAKGRASVWPNCK